MASYIRARRNILLQCNFYCFCDAINGCCHALWEGTVLPSTCTISFHCQYRTTISRHCRPSTLLSLHSPISHLTAMSPITVSCIRCTDLGHECVHHHAEFLCRSKVVCNECERGFCVGRLSLPSLLVTTIGTSASVNQPISLASDATIALSSSWGAC